METSTTLWQFLLELLLSNQYSSIITWTNAEGEFKLVNAEEVARLWGLRKNNTNMTYGKMSRALRSYYGKNIIKKVLGQNFVYRFASFRKIEELDRRNANRLRSLGLMQQQQSLSEMNLLRQVAAAQLTYREPRHPHLTFPHPSPVTPELWSWQGLQASASIASVPIAAAAASEEPVYLRDVERNLPMTGASAGLGLPLPAIHVPQPLPYWAHTLLPQPLPYWAHTLLPQHIFHPSKHLPDEAFLYYMSLWLANFANFLN